MKTWQAHARRYTGKEPTLENLKNLSAEDTKKIYRGEYWDKIDADEIKNTSLRRYIFDFHVNSSPGAAIGNLQKAINETGGNVAEDNILGKETMDALNNHPNLEALFNAYKKNRRQHFQNLAEEEVSQRNNIKGWLNRDDRFTYIK